MKTKQDLEDTIEILDEKLKEASFATRKLEWERKGIERSLSSKVKEFDSLTKTNAELMQPIDECKAICAEQELTLEQLKRDNNDLSQYLIQKEIALSASEDSLAIDNETCQESNTAVIKGNNKPNVSPILELQFRYREVEMQLHKTYAMVTNLHRRIDYESSMEDLNKKINEKANIASVTAGLCSKTEKEKARLANLLQSMQSQISLLRAQVEELKIITETV